MLSHLKVPCVRWGLAVYEQDWQDRQTVDMTVTHTNFTAGRDWLTLMGEGAGLQGVTLQYCMSLPRHVLQSAEIASVRRLRTSGDYILSKDNWRLGISTLLASALGLSSFKNVFWSSERNPGNKFYYDCMEVNNNTDPNVPWNLSYRLEVRSSIICTKWCNKLCLNFLKDKTKFKWYNFIPGSNKGRC